MIQRGRSAALVLATGLVISFGDERSLMITLAVALLAANVLLVQLVIRRERAGTALAAVGWGSFIADAATCALALAAVADDPIDPISAIAFMIAIEAAVRWGSRGALLGGLLAGGMAVAWAANGYNAIGRVLPPASIAFRFLSIVVIALPVGLLIERLRRQQEHTRRLFEHSDDAIVVTAGGRIVAANPVAATLVDTPVEELLGDPFSRHFGMLLDGRELASLVAESAHEPPPVPLLRDGQPAWVTVDAQASDDGELTFVIARDVTAERRREEELRFRAWHDHLTGLPNRAALRSRLTGRLCEGDDVGIVFLDLDGFKEINDRYGHVAGDDVLVEVADRLRQITRTTDAAYRWAGDEFCLVVDGATPDALATMAERIAETFTHGFRAGDHLVALRASVGTAVARPGDTEESLIGRADEQMYRTKDPLVRRLAR